MTTLTKYDFIICGGGMAGLSLAFYLNRSEKLRNSKILIIEPDEKNKNDRTWRFWESGKGVFDEILYGKWQKLRMVSHDFDFDFELKPYTYKKIRGIDFYNFVLAEINQNPNTTYLKDRIDKIEERIDGVKIITSSGQELFGNYAFDSTYRSKGNSAKYHYFLQHFKGWVIETEEPCFNHEIPTWMDFRIPNQQDCRFVYTLPYSKTSALVEYTLFNEVLSPEKEYDEVLKNYIESILKITKYKIVEVEQGIIPMCDEPMPEHPSKHVLRIGTSGGYTHAATGYTFARTQHFSQEIVENLEKTGIPKRNHGRLDKRFDLYASTFLDVLQKNSVSADKLFGDLLQKNKPAKVLRFLHNETTFAEEIGIMASTDLLAFGTSFFRIL